jgi:pimeloyl-ACP methyl ester carboxylesterase
MSKEMPDLDQAVIAKPWVRRWAERTFPEGVRQGVVGWELDTFLHSLPWSFDPRALAQPAVFCHGSVDPAAPYDAAHRLSQKLPSAIFITVRDGGHISVLTRTSEVLETLVSVAPEWRPAPV